MNAAPATVLEVDELRVVIEVLCTRGLLDVTVVDEEGDLRGVISLEDVLRLGLPDHLLWMHDVSPILHFEPFAELLQRGRERKAADVMQERALTVPGDTPAIEIAKRFLTEGARQIWVVEGRKLLGVIELRDFMARLLWQ
jgi:CBS domain-containing protein